MSIDKKIPLLLYLLSKLIREKNKMGENCLLDGKLIALTIQTHYCAFLKYRIISNLTCSLHWS